MKLYIKTRNKFLIISIIILIIALITILKFNNAVLGNLLLGIMASTLIIAAQSHISSTVEESRLLVDKLKKMMTLCYSFYYIKNFSLDYFKHDYEKEYKENKEKLNCLFSLNNELISIGDLNHGTKTKINEITEIITVLELDLYVIFSNYEEQTKKFKILYFMEFYKIVRAFDFDKLAEKINDLGFYIDSKEFCITDSTKINERRKREIVNNTSIQIYNKKIEENNSAEYKALKKEFERYID